MNKLTALSKKLAKPSILFTSFVVFLLLVILTNTLFKPTFNYLTQTFHYTPEEAYTLLSNINAAGRKTHLLVFISDVLMVLFYSVFLMGAIYKVYGSWLKLPKVLSLLLFLPLVLAIIQFSEVIGLTALILHYPTKFYGLARLTDALTILKYNLTPLCFLLPIIGLCVTITLKFVKSKVIMNGREE